MQEENLSNDKRPVRSGYLRILSIIAGILIVFGVLTGWWIKYNVYASPFNPTKLNENEQQLLNEKIDRMRLHIQKDKKPRSNEPADTANNTRLVPEPYSEATASREISITEKELNALIAKNEGAARRIAVDLSDDLISIKILVPVDKDSPFFGGKTLRLNCGITLSCEAGKPVIAIRGVSIGGIPVPNAWLGGIKNANLIQQFGGRGGFWDAFSKGVENIRVAEGSLYIKLKE